MMPRSGEVLVVDRHASAQFAVRPIFFRVIRVLQEIQTYDGYVWLDGYELDSTGNNAVERRSIWVQAAGLRVPKPSPSAPPRLRPAGNQRQSAGPARRNGGEIFSRTRPLPAAAIRP